jgi:peptidoglycan-associated lipoprotein
MPSQKFLVPCLALVLLLSACATRKTAPTDAGAGTAATNTTPTTDNGVAPVVRPPAATVDAGPTGGLLDKRILYFDFDKSEVRSQDMDVINAHARYLAGNPQRKLRLEGHTDARGSREYNIGLGERRGQAVRRLLMLQGAADAQILTVSFGEERPAAEGDDESAFSQNRRVELVYTP